MAKTSTQTQTASAEPPDNLPAKPDNAEALAIFDKPGVTGLENVKAQDVMIPRLVILQKLSPELDRHKPNYIPSATEGLFCDTATGEVWEQSLIILPCFYSRIYLEWAPNRQGLVANHGTSSEILKKCTQDDKRRFFLPNGNLIAETATYYVLNLLAGNRRSFIPLASTQLRAARRWMTSITGERIKRPDGSEFTPPIYYRAWQATTVSQSNVQGAWYGWKFDPGPTVLEIDSSQRLLQEARAFATDVRDGLVAGDLRDLEAEQD